MPGSGKDGKGGGKATTKPATIASQAPVTSPFTNRLTPARSATSSQSSKTTSSVTSSPTTTTVDSQSTNLSAITGGLVGGIFALIGIILLLWFARQGRKRISQRPITKASWSPASSTNPLYHRSPSLPPSMQSIRAMHPVTESPFEEQYGQEPYLQLPENGHTQQGYH